MPNGADMNVLFEKKEREVLFRLVWTASGVAPQVHSDHCQCVYCEFVRRAQDHCIRSGLIWLNGIDVPM